MALNVADGCITVISGTKSKTFAVKSMGLDYDSLATEDSGRDDGGDMHIEFILSRTRKIGITLPPLPRSEVSEILDLVLGRIYTIRYLDAIDGIRTLVVYTSKGSVNLYNGKIRGGIWDNAKFNAIDMKGET